jgi:uncharacterized alpha-E superfamily protein
MSNLLNFFALDGNNPCSIYSCVEMAWNNAHAVRGSLSAEVWESINATRIELRQLRQQGISELGSDGFFEWVKSGCICFAGGARHAAAQRRPEFYRYRHADRAGLRHHAAAAD